MNEKISTLQEKARALGGEGLVGIHGTSATGFAVVVDDFQFSAKTVDEAVDGVEALLNEEARSRIVRLKGQIDSIKAVWNT